MATSFLSVEQHPPEHIQLLESGARVAVTYRKRWDDGFGARGWKLNATIGDPEIIASTRETGTKISTSVFIHDILDHFLSGFGVSGHRSEAMALIQLSKRTGSDPGSDYQQMVEEDIMKGRVNGERLSTFLPEALLAMFAADAEMPDKEIMSFLIDKLGEAPLKARLVAHFFTLGRAGEKHAYDSWIRLGLNPGKNTAIGLALQDILNRADNAAEASGVETLKASITINNSRCVLALEHSPFPESSYAADVT